MDLLDIYSAMQRGDITVEEAAVAMNMPLRTLKFRLTRWNHRLPLLLSVLDKCRHGTIDRQEASSTLQVSPREVNHLMVNWRVVKPIPTYLVMKATSEIKWELRKKYAIDYIAGSCRIEEAAEGAHVSSRQMRRWVSELLQKHFGMVFKDLRQMPYRKLQRIAQEIEESEGLELAKQNVLKEVADGRRAIEEEALDRVVDRRRRHR